MKALFTKSISIFLLLFIGLNTWLSAQNIPAKPAPARYMVDNAKVLSAEEAQAIEDKLYAFHLSEMAQIVVVTVANLDGETVETYATKLFNTWGIGDKVRNDGVLLLISKNDRKMRIEVGYGLEDKITDAIAANIIAYTLSPNFKKGDFYEGIRGASNNLISKISPQYRIPSNSLDSLKAEIWLAKENKKKAAEEKAIAENAAAAATYRQIIIYIAIGLFVFFAIFIASRRNRKSQQQKNEQHQAQIALNQALIKQLDSLKNTAAYKALPLVKDFADGYAADLQAMIKALAKNSNLAQAIKLTNDMQLTLSGYLLLADAYQKVALSSNFPDTTYYPEEVARCCQKNMDELESLSSIAEVSQKSKHFRLKEIADSPPSKKISCQAIDNLAAFPSFGSSYNLVVTATVPLLQAIEQIPDFQALINKNTQAQAALHPKAKAALAYLDALIHVLQMRLTAQENIGKIDFVQNLTSEQLKEIIKKISPPNEAIIASLQVPFLSQDIDKQLAIIREKLNDHDIKKKIANFETEIYSDIFSLLVGIINNFLAKTNFTEAYKSFTLASISAYETGIRQTVFQIQQLFKQGQEAQAFAELVDMFNGLFSTYTFSTLYLKSIVTHSYSSRSSSSSSSYSDSSRSAYSDSAYSDSAYSDSSYSDSSYGGGSSGGGGASGSW